MADTIRRVYEIDAKLSTTALASLKAIQQNLKETEGAAKSAGAGAKKMAHDLEETGSAFSKLNFQSVGARRELLVLVHELSQGNYKQFAGSLLVLGERIDATSLIMSKAGISAIALGATIAGLSILVAKGALEQDAFNKSLQLTGNYAAATNDSIAKMSRDIAAGTQSTAGGVEHLARILVAQGNVGPTAFKPLLEAMTTVKRLTGETAEEVAAKFKNFAVEPTKAAVELSKQFNFLDSATYSAIKRAEELGERERAAAIAADALTAAFKERQLPAIGLLAEGYLAFQRGLDRISHYFVSIGAETTFEAKLDSLYKKLGDLEKQANKPSLLSKLGSIFGITEGSAAESELEGTRAQIQAVLAQKVQKENEAAQRSIDARTKSEAVSAQQELDNLDKTTRGYNRKKKELEELARQEEAVRKDRRRTDPTFEIDPKVHALRVEEIERRNKTSSDKKLETAVESRLRALGEEDAALKESIRQYDEYGKKLNNAARAKLEFDITQGNLRGASGKELTELRKRADAVDADREILHQREAAATADKRIAQLKNEAEAHAQNSREIQLAVELGKLETDGLVKGTAAYEDRAKSIQRYTNQIHDNALARKLAANESQTAEEARAITDEIDLIGKSTLARTQYIATLRIQRRVAKELEENPENAFEIIASAKREIDDLTGALEKNYEAQRKFESGAKEAFSHYLEDAENAAKFSGNVIAGGLQQLEDVFVNFAKTGKLNFSDLFSFMADEFIRQSVRMSISGILKDTGAQDGIQGALKSIAKVFGIDFGGTKGGAAGAGGAGAAATTTAASLTALGGTSDIAALSLDLLDTSASLSSFTIDELATAAQAAASALFEVATSSGVSEIGEAAGDFDWASLFDFGANGGIMSSRGLNAYANGGIATGPQMAIFGEGRMNEAFVPLPDGRSIPVSFEKSNVSSDSSGVNVTIENHNGSDVSVKRQKNTNGKDELRIFVRAAKQAILDDIYGGGDFDKAMGDKYGLLRATPRMGN